MGPSAISLLSLLILAASASLPRVVVPNFPDLTIKTRRVVGGRPENEMTLYLQGPRQRREFQYLGQLADSSKHVTIMQCDERRQYILDEQWKTYSDSPIEDWQQRMKRARHVPQDQTSNAEVIVTVDSVDTGERRKFGSFEARRIKTTTKVEPSPGALMEARITELDGWYIDLPGLGCQEPQGQGVGLASFLVAGQPQKRGRVIVKQLGTAKRGFALEETSREIERNVAKVSETKLLAFSESPLDHSLFDLPSDYRPALHQPYGGRDMTKPDTLANRLQAYWEFSRDSVRRWF